MNYITCPNCKSPNKEDSFFCENCGEFLLADKYEKSSYDKSQFKLMRIIENLRKFKPSITVLDEAFAYQSQKMEQLKALYNLPEFSDNKNLCEKISTFLSLCSNPEFQIAFVGSIKTGKSTLINSLLGKNYASWNVTPETAALTKFRFSPKDYIIITFYDKEEWEQLWQSRKDADKFMEEYISLNADSCKDVWVGHEQIRKELANSDILDELSKWSTSKTAEHYFVKEIEVGISTLPKTFPPQVVLVDTPGLNDPVGYRSDLTKNYIRKANAVFVCVESKKLEQYDIETISTALSVSANNKEKVYIIATQWDRLNNPDTDWEVQSEYVVKQITGKGFYDTEDIARSHLIYTAAAIHNICRDFDENTSKEDKKILQKFALNFDEFDISDSDVRKKLSEKSNIETVLNLISDNFASNYKELLVQDINSLNIDIRAMFRRIALDFKNDKLDFLNSTYADLEQYKQIVEQKRKDYQEIKAVSNALKDFVDALDKQTMRKTQAICDQLRKKAKI
jgi:GTPase SAR1 family protein